VSTALPRIVAALGNIELLSWVVSAYLLTSTATVIIYGKLSDMHGRKKLLLLGIAVFLAGSVLSGLSQDIMQLIVFRALQGIGGGAIMVNAMAIIGDLFPPAERGRWQGVTGAVFAVSSIADPLLGGFLTDYVSWHWIFFINVPIGAFSIAVLLKFLPDSKGNGGSVDWKGSAMLTAAVVLLMLGLLAGGTYYPWLSAETLGLFGLSTAAFIAFALIEKRAEEPVLHPEIFGNGIFLVSIAVTFLAAAGMFGALVYLPLFAQAVLGMSAAGSGIVMMPMALATVAGSTVAGQVMSRTGRYRAIAIAGMGVMSLGMVLLAMLGPGSSGWELVRDIALVGAGLGTTFPVFIVAVQNAFEHSRMGVVTSALQFFRSIGGLVGTAVFGPLWCRC
jgi:EmrB/QacA subfamily drug resistance transporter